MTTATQTSSLLPSPNPLQTKARLTRSVSRNGSTFQPGEREGSPTSSSSSSSSRQKSGSSSLPVASRISGSNLGSNIETPALFSPSSYDWCLFDEEDEVKPGGSQYQATESEMKDKSKTSQSLLESRKDFRGYKPKDRHSSPKQGEHEKRSHSRSAGHESPTLPELDPDSQSDGTIERPATPERIGPSRMLTSPSAPEARLLEPRRPGLQDYKSPSASFRKPSFRSQVLESSNAFEDSTEMQDLISAQKLFPELFERLQEGNTPLQPSQHRRVLAHLKRDLAGVDLATLRGPLRSIASHQQQQQQQQQQNNGLPTARPSASGRSEKPQTEHEVEARSQPKGRSGHYPSSFAKNVVTSPERLPAADPSQTGDPAANQISAQKRLQIPSGHISDLPKGGVRSIHGASSHHFSTSSSSSSEDDEWRRRQGGPASLIPARPQSHARLYPMAPPLIPHKRPFLHRDSVSSSASSGSSSRSPIGGGMTASSSSTSDDDLDDEEEDINNLEHPASPAAMQEGSTVNAQANKVPREQMSSNIVQSRAPATHQDLSAQMDTTCSNCGTHFARIYDLQRHQETKHGDGAKVEWICDFCPDKKHFSRKDALQRHKRIKHGRLM